MGLIRGSLFIIASILIFFVFLSGNAFFILSSSLEYENIKPELISITDDLIKEYNIDNEIEENFLLMKDYCENNSEFVFESKEFGETLTIPCEIVNQGPEKIIEKSREDFISNIYYKEYSCDFWNCFEKEENIFFLISEKAKNYWKEKFYLSLILSVLLSVVMFLLIKNKTSLPIILGSLLILSLLPFLKINWIFSFVGESLSTFFQIFFSKASLISIKGIIFGAILIILGIALKVFKISYKISDFFNKNIFKKESKNTKKGSFKK
jgi:hypothetical protein